MKISLTTIIVSLLIIAGCQKHANHQSYTLGEVQLEVTGAEAAKPHFNKGLLLLHSFEYDDAAENFRKAQEVDSDFAMAYWGEAMTHNHPLWRSQDVEAGRTILKRLAPDPATRIAKVQTEIEKDFLRATEILYGQNKKPERNKLYSAHMLKMYEDYPHNQDVAAFYALSLLAIGSADRDSAAFEKAAIIAQGVIKENPQHPGGLHYLIHSYDDPDHAHLALNAANVYSQVAPDAAHALHMPSHIYVALGMWDEVITSNIASYAAANKRRAKKNLGNDARNYHAFQWLMYGYLQKGDIEKAEGMMRQIEEYVDDDSSGGARAYHARMKGAFLIAANDWLHPVGAFSVKDDDLNISIRAVNNFVDGIRAYSSENPEGLKGVIAEMIEEREEAKLKVMQRGAQLCTGVGLANQLPNQHDIDQAHVMEMQLQAMYAILCEDSDQVEMWMNEAAELEESTSFSFGPPTIVKPSHELYGEWLLNQKSPGLALEHFDKALVRAPGRLLSVEGRKMAEAAS